jgi:hypothetical protein
MVTPSTAATWGPLVDYSSTVSINVAGCIELLDPSQVSCAQTVQAADVCQHQACDTACPVGQDAGSFTDWESCVRGAAQGECSAYVGPASCALTVDAGPAAACVSGKSFADDFLAIAAVFCATLTD